MLADPPKPGQASQHEKFEQGSEDRTLFRVSSAPIAEIDERSDVGFEKKTASMCQLSRTIKANQYAFALHFGHASLSANHTKWSTQALHWYCSNVGITEETGNFPHTLSGYVAKTKNIDTGDQRRGKDAEGL